MVQTGLSVLLRERLDLLSGRRVGLVSQAAAVLPDLTGILDALLAAGVRVSALFSAEHGFAGAASDGAQVGDRIDARSGLPLYSLYGSHLEPQPEALRGLDLLLVDFQDVGARFYTYISTLYYVLRGAGRAELPVIVLDRPNPLGGARVEGPLIQPGFESFVGIFSLPVRHGLTFGELALLMNAECRLKAPLAVVAMKGWERSLRFEQTGLPWVPTSPAMPHLSTATVYPGMCFIEGTSLSEGRGTALPFETAGAPWLDGSALAAELNRLDLPGARFRPHAFTPGSNKHSGQVCEGVQVHLTDPAGFEPVRAGLHVLAACRGQRPDRFVFLPAQNPADRMHFDLLTGSAEVRAQLEAGALVDDIVSAWVPGCAAFEKMRVPYLLYA